MTATTMTARDELEAYLEAFSRLSKGEDDGGGPAWLRPVRETAMARSQELGFPTTRDEEWKFTNVAPISGGSFELSRRPGKVDAEDLSSYRLPGLECSRLVFVDGHFVSELSSVRPLPKGVKVGSLKDALAAESELVEAHLARYADYQSDFFASLNTAFMLDGGFVYLPRAAVLKEPVHLLFVSTERSSPTVTHPRNLIVAEEVSECAVIEEYVSLGGEGYFSNAVTELVAAEGSVVQHYLVERESTSAFNVGTLRIQQGRASNVASHTALFGGALIRNNVHPVLAGEGAYCMINGLFMPAGRQHMDNFMRVEHASPHCDSRQFYNGILDGHGRGVFSGRIVVHKPAQKTDAKQTNRNLLLSDEAQMDSKPQLEIYADDVKCTHGATIGQLDADAIFYLRSRGMDADAARSLLLFGFAAESLERMKIPEVRKYVESLVVERLPQGMASQNSS